MTDREARPGAAARGLLPGTAPETRLGALRARLLGRVARVRSPRFWRLLYWLLARRTTVRAAAALLRAAERARPGMAKGALARAGQLLVESGWPHQGPGWVNLDLSRFVARTRHALVPRPRAVPKPPRARLDEPLRVGVVGELGRPLVFSDEHFRAAPPELELSVFDVEHTGRHAASLAGIVAHYEPFPAVRGDPAGARALAAAVNAADLDLLLFLSGPGNAYELIDALETPCIGFATITSNLLFHERVGFQLYWQPQADYFFRDGEFFCGLSRAPFRQPGVLPAFLPLGSQGFQDAARARPWEERAPLLVFHGSLFKASTPSYLETVFGLLREDERLEFVLMGRDDGRALGEIEAAARAHGVEGRVHYEGAFSLVRTPDGGAIADPGWERLLDLLGRARLAPDPWPLGGGQSRLEAYVLRTPAAHMAVRFDPDAWGRPQLAAVEFPRLLVPELSATTVEGYREVCRRCLYEREFAEHAVAAQERAAASVLDAREWWLQVRDAYLSWRRERGHA